MEFDELKKIWDTQNNQPMYAINEKALHRRVIAKKKSAGKIANWMEVILIGVNLVGGSMLLFGVLFKGKEDETFIYLLMAIMYVTPLYLFYKRSKRKKFESQFERTMMGDLEHALSNASYSEVLSRTMQVYFAFIAILTLFSLWFDKDTSLIPMIGFALLFIFTLYASTWEHKIYVRKRRELEKLKKTLEEDSE
ncbi:MAG TPA: hypothetical protein PKL31_09465 [Fulvivirga sp.]|nr:hypothetical protein [Fulvivirga sp.]